MDIKYDIRRALSCAGVELGSTIAPDSEVRSSFFSGSFERRRAGIAPWRHNKGEERIFEGVVSTEQLGNFSDWD